MPSNCDSIFRATIFSSTKLLQLLNQKCDPNVEGSSDGLTPLYWASFARKSDSAILLIAFGADVNKKLMESKYRLPIGITPMHAAAYSGALEIARILKENTCDLNARDAVGQTPLHYCVCDNVRVVSALLEGGADTLLKDLNGRSPLFYCLNAYTDYYIGRGSDYDLYGDSDYRLDHDDLNIDIICVELLSHLKNIKEIKFPGGGTVLHLAIQSRHRFVNEYILNSLDVDINARDDDGLTPLHVAAYSYKNEGWPAEILLNKGANPYISSNEGLFPLDIAINIGNEAVVEILRKVGAPENENTRELLKKRKAEASQSPLEAVNKDIDKSQPDILHPLDASSHAHVQIDTSFRRGWFDELYDVIKFLIFHGVDVNSQDSMGHSPLHRAILGDCGGNRQIEDLRLYLAELILWPDLDDLHEMKDPDVWEDYVKNI